MKASASLVFLLIALHGWAETPAYRSALIEGVPHVKQKPDFCGEACAEMYLSKLGKKINQDCVFEQSGVDPALGRGCWTAELARALRKIGFKLDRSGSEVKAATLAAGMEAQWAALHADLLAGVPSIICTYFSDAPNTTEHFRLILGYDRETDVVIYHDPAVDDGAYLKMKRPLFLKLWPLKYTEQSRSVIRMRLEPGEIADAPPAAEGFSKADFAQHVLALKEKTPLKGFTIIVQPPFVVLGDEPPETVRMRATGTVKWAVDALRKDFFAKDPADILDIWLFKDKTSYEHHAEKIFGDTPTTPYGYYSHENRALVMNIATGGGTLVHEIVHPFMRANFPQCPAWFNEGLGSLYEQSSERGGHIIGLTNWRLPALQKSIKAGEVPSFKELTGTTEREFYNADKGTNYAEARYLCYYLQEKNLLVKFYHQFAANSKDDPTGFETLKKVLGEKDMDAFQKKWEEFVLKLRFR